MRTHGWTYIDAEDAGGNVENWAIELIGINTLLKQGWTPNVLKLGDVVHVEGFGARELGLPNSCERSSSPGPNGHQPCPKVRSRRSRIPKQSHYRVPKKKFTPSGVVTLRPLTTGSPLRAR